MQITRPLGFQMPDKKKYNQFNIPLYFGWLYVEFGNINEILKDFEQEPTAERGVGGRAVTLNSHNFLIAFNEDSRKDPSIWAHEAVHIANMIFLERGVTYTLTNDEHFCYLVTWIMEQIQTAAK